MDRHPLVTIAIPTYNRADSYLPGALQCALQQTYPHLDVIVSDNASTDRTRALVTSIGDRRLRYFRHDVNIGANNNFNFCLQQARGKYLLLLHDDDLIDLDCVESSMRAEACSSEAGVIRTGTRIIDSEGKIISELPNSAGGLSTEDFFRAWFSGHTAISLCSTLYNTARLRERGGFHSRHNCYQDTMAVVELAARHGRVDVAEIKASFRRHAGEMGLRRTMKEWCEDSIILLNLMGGLVPQSSAQILKEGTRFLARANYGRAAGASSPWKRAVASIEVVRYFRYRQFPSPNVTIRILSGRRLYNTLGRIKRFAVGPLRALAAR